MGSPEALQLVEGHLARGIDNIRGSRVTYRRGARLQTLLLAFLSATTTFLIGLNAIYHRPALVAISLGTAGMATVASTWTSWLGFRQLLHASTVTLALLWQLRDQMEYDKAKLDDKVPEELIDGYHERLQEIFGQHNDQWEKIRSSARQ